MLRIHPGIYFALTLLGILLAYWAIWALNSSDPEGSNGALVFWLMIDLIATLFVAVMGVIVFAGRDRQRPGDRLSRYYEPRAPKSAAGPDQMTRGFTDWSQRGEAPRRSSGRDPIGRRV